MTPNTLPKNGSAGTIGLGLRLLCIFRRPTPIHSGNWPPPICFLDRLGMFVHLLQNLSVGQFGIVNPYLHRLASSLVSDNFLALRHLDDWLTLGCIDFITLVG